MALKPQKLPRELAIAAASQRFVRITHCRAEHIGKSPPLCGACEELRRGYVGFCIAPRRETPLSGA